MKRFIKKVDYEIYQFTQFITNHIIASSIIFMMICLVITGGLYIHAINASKNKDIPNLASVPRLINTVDPDGFTTTPMPADSIDKPVDDQTIINISK